MRGALRVLVLEDDARMAAYLDRGLTGAGYAVATVPNGHAPDVIVAAGLDRLAQAQALAAPVLLLTTNDAVGERIRGLDAGADDVLGKPFDVHELLARLRALARRRECFRAEGHKGALRYADLELDQDRREVTRGGRRLQLRNRAFELLAYCMRHPERVLSRRELVAQVWGWDEADDSNVVEVTVSQLRRALGEPGLIHTVRPIGYILRAC